MTSNLEYCKGAQKCPSLKRLIMCLHFYNTIGDYMEDDDDNLLLEYFKQYTNLLNDYGHILSVHLNNNKQNATQINKNYIIISNQINKYLKCKDIVTCKHYLNNQRERESDEKNNKNSQNEKMLYYVDILDTIHTFFVHSIDMGYRINDKQIKNKHMDYIDHTLNKSKLQNIIINTNNAYISGGDTFNFADNDREETEYKYSNLKEEIISNNIFTVDINEYNKILFKANQYLSQSQIIKAMKCNQYKTITLPHLISILLFIDYKKCALYFCQTLTNEYRNWYKLITEIVQLFGEKSCESQYYVSISHVDDNAILFDRFTVNLCKPLMVTQYISSAIITAKENGIILTLKHNDFMCFNCNFLSYFGYNNELLICGEYKKAFKIDNIRCIKNKINYKMFIKPMSFLDDFLNEIEIKEMPKEHDCDILNILIHQTERCPKYVNKLFENFVNQKENIIINMSILNTFYYGLLNPLILNKMCNNLVSIHFLCCKLFKNCKFIEIKMAQNENNAFVVNEVFVNALFYELGKINEKTKQEIKLTKIKISHLKIEDNNLNIILKNKFNELKWIKQITHNENDKNLIIYK